MTCFRGIADDLELMDWLNNYIFPAEAKNVNPHLAYWGSLFGLRGNDQIRHNDFLRHVYL